MTSRHRSRLPFFSLSLSFLSRSLFSLSLSLSRIRGKRTYRPHRCPQCDGGIDLKVHSCFHNAVSVPTFKLSRSPLSLLLHPLTPLASNSLQPLVCRAYSPEHGSQRRSRQHGDQSDSAPRFPVIPLDYSLLFGPMSILSSIRPSSHLFHPSASSFRSPSLYLLFLLHSFPLSLCFALLSLLCIECN